MSQTEIVMKHLFRIYILLFMLTSDFKMFADDGPGDGSDDGDIEGDDDPAVPINGKILFLLVAGILFAFYQYKMHRKTSAQQ